MLCAANQHRALSNQSPAGSVDNISLPGVMFLGLAETFISNSALLPASYRISIDHSAASR
jgi:hypothetical protein